MTVIASNRPHLRSSDFRNRPEREGRSAELPYGFVAPGIWIIGIAAPLTCGITPFHFFAISY